MSAIKGPCRRWWGSVGGILRQGPQSASLQAGLDGTRKGGVVRKSQLTVAVVVGCAVVLATLLTVGCSKNKGGQGNEDQAKNAEPAQVVQPAPPGTVRVSHILVAYQGSGVEGVTRTKEEALKLAQDLLARVNAGEKFDEVAANYSDCPSAEAGGDLGFFGRGRMVKPFEDAAFGLKPGGVSGIVETQFGYHIIKRTQ